ncbi:MAG: CRISPR-associated helicase Cas3' [Methanosarcinaceae archaeon]|nr:CRISPR-associated helicase Cas3' [Methanosarcinaceae archaeon]
MNDYVFYARESSDKSKKQLLTDHISGVLSRSSLWAPSGFENIQKLCALLHDFGKFSVEWQEYILNESEKTVPHSPHGAYFVVELHNNYIKNNEQNKTYSKITSDILKYVIASHHGMFDAMSVDGVQNIESKELNFSGKYGDIYENCRINYLNQLNKIDQLDINQLEIIYSNSVDEISSFLNIFKSDGDLSKGACYYLGFLVRMLLSNIIDSDWSDAASFIEDDEEKWNEKLNEFRWEFMINNIEEGIKKFDQDTEINKLRSKISKECEKSSVRGKGVYKLNVPTGGGKTIAVMRFALKHAKIHKMDRIIYAAPYKSILEQNAKEYKKYLLGSNGSLDDRFILEHHGDAIKSDDFDEKDKNSIVDFLINSWNSPVILTTTVQLLLTLFSSKKASIRRTHKLYNSIIIIDEFQSIPIKSISLFNLAINALSEFFNSTVVLCTATQPPYEKAIKKDYSDSKIPNIRYTEKPDLVGNYSNEEGFKRTKIIDMRNDTGGYTLDEFKELVLNRMEDENTLLVILNTRAAVSKLYNTIIKENPDFELRGLSNNMVPAHRDKVLEETKKLMEQGKRVLLISTALIEAGVDISFSGVIRSLTGLDTIIQAAGRCNRNGETDVGEVWVVNLDKEFENISRLEDVKVAREKTEAILNDFNKKPEKYDNSISSEKSLNEYFKYFLEDSVKKTKYPFDDKNKGNEYELFDLLSCNQKGVMNYKSKNDVKILQTHINQAFLTAGRNYRPIENNQIELLVDWGDGQDIIINLNSDSTNFYDKKRLLDRSSLYIVQIYGHVFENLKDKGAIYNITLFDKEIPVLRSDYYGDIGVFTGDEKKEQEFCCY